jgi:hypothetical protein
MAKRFTDTAKWDDPWFAELPSKYKLFWVYLLDECDHAGIWKVNFRKAQFMIGESLEQAEVMRYMSDRVKKVDESYWLVTKFVKFQYGSLKRDNVGISATAILKKHGLESFILQYTEAPHQPLPSPSVGAKDKDMDKDMDKALDLNKEEEGVFAKIENAKSYLELMPIWVEYRKTKGSYPTPYETDVMKNAWKAKPLGTLKAEMLKAIENGWKSLVEQKTKAVSATPYLDSLDDKPF